MAFLEGGRKLKPEENFDLKSKKGLMPSETYEKQP